MYDMPLRTHGNLVYSDVPEGHWALHLATRQTGGKNRCLWTTWFLRNLEKVSSCTSGRTPSHQVRGELTVFRCSCPGSTGTFFGGGSS